MADADKDARLAAARQKAELLKKRKAKKSKKGEGEGEEGSAATTAETLATAPEGEGEEHHEGDGEGEGQGDNHETEQSGATDNGAAEAVEDAPAEATEDTPTETAAAEDIPTETAAPETETAENDDSAAPEPEPVPEDHSSPAASPPPTTTLAQQSKIRSASFRAGPGGPGAPLLSPGPLSPEGGEIAADIYRKQVTRIDELEKENKRLAKEAGDANKRWTKAEEELAEIREGDKGSDKKEGDASEADELKSKVAALERQNVQLQQQVSRATGRHGSSPSIATIGTAELEAQLASKSATIETMELELSRLRAQAERGTSSEKEQIAALEDKLARAESAAGAAQRELADVKKTLEQSSKKAVQDSSERTSAETKIRILEQELFDAKKAHSDAADKVDALEKKVATLTTLHREQDGRMHALRREKEGLEAELAKVTSRARKSVDGGGGLDDEGVDELENEVRLRLERKVRDLEAELHEARRGAWRDKRRELDVPSPSAAGFENIDLGSSPGGHKRRPTMSAAAGGIGEFLASGLNVLTGGGGGGGGGEGSDEMLDDLDDDFDEGAFRAAQEEMMMRRIERVREVKRGLKNWEGWRVDLVGLGGLGVGEIFEV